MTRDPSNTPFAERNLSRPPRILAMGNVGRTQGLEVMVEAFETDPTLAEVEAEMLIAGSGVALDSVRSRIQTDRVQTPGVVDGETLDGLLESSHLGLVSQKAGLQEFNLPSKLMNYMSFGVPVIASVDSGSETARIVRDSGAGWVTDPGRPEQFAQPSHGGPGRSGRARARLAGRVSGSRPRISVPTESPVRSKRSS